MAKKPMYAIGVIRGLNTIKFVTRIGDHHTAYWEDGKEAMYFTKEFALDVCKGFAWNGIGAFPILQQEFLELRNYVEENEVQENVD